MNAKHHQDSTSVDSNLVDDSLARTARQLHAAAVANVSASTQSQLHQRRRRALAGKGDPTQGGMVRPLAWAGAFAVLALAIVLPMAMPPPPAPTTTQVAGTAAIATAASAASSSGDTPLATLEEDPEMYVWLASSDAIALASE